MSVTPLKWFDNQKLAKIALELELHKDSSERTLNTPQAIEILTKYIPSLEATDLTSTRKALLGTSSTLALVGKCFLVVGLKPDAPLEGRDWINMCYEAIEGFPNHQRNKDGFILPVLNYIEAKAVNPSDTARRFWAEVREFCKP